MTKKLVALMFAAVLLVSLLSVPAFAVGVLPQPNEYYGGGVFYPTTPGGTYNISGSINPPRILSVSGSAYAVTGGVPAALRVDAYSDQGYALGYQWYSYDSYGSLVPISGASSSAYTPTASYGTRYYCVGVYAVNGGMRSSEVFSESMSVTYSGVRIVTPPTKTQYYVGEKVDLSGLAVHVYDEAGGFWVSNNGNGLSVYPSQFNTAGKVAVEISNGLSSDVFYVTVGTAEQKKAANHTHEFGDWEVTKEATCVTTGMRTRTCSCGEKETEEILKTDHIWDEGTITKEATASNNGSRLYTCEICKANRSEIIPAGTQSPQPTTSLDAAAAANPNVVINQGDPSRNPSSTYNNAGNNTYSNFGNTQSLEPAGASASQTGVLDGTQTGGTAENAAQTGTVVGEGSSGWWLIPVSAVVLVGTGIGAYYLMQKKGGE